MTTPRVLPVLMREGEIIGLKEAVDRSKRSPKTIARWCRQSGIGRQAEPSAPWEISAVALEAKLYGDVEAIEALRQGDFSSPLIKRYVQCLGIQQ
jgi:hypothetical protein